MGKDGTSNEKPATSNFYPYSTFRIPNLEVPPDHNPRILEMPNPASLPPDPEFTVRNFYKENHLTGLIPDGNL